MKLSTITETEQEIQIYRYNPTADSGNKIYEKCRDITSDEIWVSEKANLLFVSIYKTKPVGCLWGLIEKSNIEKYEYAFMVDVVVQDSYRHLNIGPKLIQAAKKEYDSLQKSYGNDIFIGAEITNPKLANILQKRYNFVPIDNRGNWGEGEWSLYTPFLVYDGVLPENHKMDIKHMLQEQGNTDVIKTTTRQLEDLLEIIHYYKEPETISSFNEILRSPDTDTLRQNSWIFNRIEQLLTQDDTLKSNTKKKAENAVADLKRKSPATLIASLYSLPKNTLKKTPLKGIGLSPQDQKKLKSTLGPQGYISSLNSASDIPMSSLKKWLNAITRKSEKISNQIHKDIPNVKQYKDF